MLDDSELPRIGDKFATEQGQPFDLDGHDEDRAQINVPVGVSVVPLSKCPSVERVPSRVGGQSASRSVTGREKVTNECGRDIAVG